MKKFISCLGLLILIFGNFFTTHAVQFGPDGEPIFKVSFVGDAGVGKTSILMRMLKDIFVEGLEATIGCNNPKLTLNCECGQLNCRMWDTAGQDRYRSLTPQYTKDSDLVLMVCSIDNLESIENLTSGYDILLSSLGKNTKTILIGNKIDMADENPQEYSRTDFVDGIEAIKDKLNLENALNVEDYILVSAKTSEGIDLLKESIGKSLSNIKIITGDKCVNIGEELSDKKASCCKK